MSARRVASGHAPRGTGAGAGAGAGASARANEDVGPSNSLTHLRHSCAIRCRSARIWRTARAGDGAIALACSSAGESHFTARKRDKRVLNEAESRACSVLSLTSTRRPPLTTPSTSQVDLGGDRTAPARRHSEPDAIPKSSRSRHQRDATHYAAVYATNPTQPNHASARLPPPRRPSLTRQPDGTPPPRSPKLYPTARRGCCGDLGRSRLPRSQSTLSALVNQEGPKPIASGEISLVRGGSRGVGSGGCVRVYCAFRWVKFGALARLASASTTPMVPACRPATLLEPRQLSVVPKVYVAR